MKNLMTCRLFLFFVFSFLFFGSSIDVHAQRGRSKTIADATYGSGGSKSILSKKAWEMIIYRDPNQVRRLMEVARTSAIKNDSVKTTAKMYFDNTGKKEYFNQVIINIDMKPINKLQARYSDDKLLSATSWNLDNGTGVSFNYNLLSKKFEVAGQYMDNGVYKPDITPGTIKGVLASKFKFSYPVTGNNHFTSSLPGNEYMGGKEMTDAYSGFDEYSGQEVDYELKKFLDKRGILRHELYREYYEDGWVYEEEIYYDCYGNRQYYSETWYDNYDGYEYEVYEAYYKKGEKTAGYYYCYDYWGDEEYYDPKTKQWVYHWSPGLNKPEDFEPDTDDCPGSYAYWSHDFFAGPSLIREDDGADGFYLFGFEGTYTRNFSRILGVTVDAGINFRNENNTKLTKIMALAGVTYWAKKANYSEPLVFSLHTLAGISNIRNSYSSTYGSFKSSNTYFTLCAGLAVGYYFADKLGVGLRLDALPTFSKNNTSINARASLGVMFRSRRVVAARQQREY